MALSQRLDLRQTLKQVMTPQLQQAIGLLQLSNLELGSYLAEEIEKNPFLEDSVETEEPTPQPEQLDVIRAEGSSATADRGSSSESENTSSEPPEHDENWSSEEYGSDGNYSDRSSSSGSGGSLDSDYAEAQNVAAGPSLREHLVGQIQVDFADPPSV